MDKQAQQMLLKLQKTESMYSLLSLCTRMPYVECDKETFDDKVFVFFDEADAKEMAKQLMEEKRPVQSVRLGNQAFLAFFAGLIPMGVNCVVMKEKEGEPVSMQLNEVIRIPDKAKISDGKILIENPELHLTALYYMQEVKSDPQAQETEAVKELYEEMLSHFRRGRYIVPVKEGGKGIPMMKHKNGEFYHPLFTDAQEFQKFCVLHKEEKFQTIIVEGENLHKILANEAKGMTLNPMGVNVILQIMKKTE